jgi:hypothetical protein
MTHSVRPPILNRILEVANARDEKDHDIYVQFLSQAWLTTKNPKGINVRLSWSRGDITQTQTRNCSLCTIFFYYAKVQAPSTKIQKSCMTSDEEISARESLSFFELMMLLRDFRILPKLLTKDEVIFLYRIMCSQKKARRDINVLLTFEDFKDFFARVAILIFNKPLVKKISTKSTGKMPTFKDQINGLASYLHLDDMHWVRERIHTVGAESVRMVNSRSAGEVNHHTKVNLRNDLKARRVSNFLSDGETSGHHSAVSVDLEQMRSIVEAIQMNMSSSLHQTTNKNSEQYNPIGIDEDLQGSHATLLDLVAGRLERGEALTGLIEEEDTGTGPPDAKKFTAAGSVPARAPYHTTTAPANIPPMPLLRSTGAGTGGIRISRTQEIALMGYHVSFTSVLDKYCDVLAYQMHKKHSDETIEESISNQVGYLDLGSVEEGEDCVIRLGVSNLTSHDATISVETEGIPALAGVRVTSLPLAIAPGLSTVIYVAFTVCSLPHGLRNALGFLRVSSAYPHSSTTSSSSSTPIPRPAVSHICPIFMRVLSGEQIEKRCALSLRQYPLCSTGTRETLHHRFVNGQSDGRNTPRTVLMDHSSASPSRVHSTYVKFLSKKVSLEAEGSRTGANHPAQHSNNNTANHLPAPPVNKLVKSIRPKSAGYGGRKPKMLT